MLKELGSLYRITVRPDFLVSCDVLEEKLQMYMSRIEYLDCPVNKDRSIYSSPRPAEQSTTHLVSENGCRSFANCKLQDSELDDEGETFDPRKLFCFCWLPENACESGSLIQCDSCQEWYHPECVNKACTVRQRRKGKKCSGAFECPLCLYDSQKPVNFLFPIVSEWVTTQPEIVIDKKAQRASEPDLESPNEEMGTSERNNLSEESNLPLKEFTKKKIGNKKVSSKDWLTPEDLSALLTKDKDLLCINNVRHCFS
jgi:hypothetical protein